MGRLEGRRILLVGASSGIGRATAGVFAGEGARVAALARRSERLDSLAGEVGESLTPVVCDVRDEDDCVRAMTSAESALGGVDALVYCTAIAPLVALRDADSAGWHDAFQTNVVGASLLTRAALPALNRSRGRALFLSSVAVGEQPARNGLGLYVASKAALEAMVDVWRIEEPEVAFTCVRVGDTFPSEITAGWDPSAAAEYLQQWNARGVLFGSLLDAADVGRHLADLLATPHAVPVSTITPR